MRDFVHLHVHTQYSLLDGAGRLDKMMEKAKGLGMSSIAITDHGVMYGVVDFYKQAKKYGIKPIIGCEVYVATRGMEDRDPKYDSDQYHLVLLAKNETGYRNITYLVSQGFIKGFYYKPRVDVDLLRRYSEGIIAMSACLAGSVQQYILNGNYERAKEEALTYLDIFGEDNFYLELQDHGIREQALVNQELIRMSHETGIPLVATNDVHYVDREDAQVHDVLLCIQTGKTIDDENRMKFETDEFYIKSSEEMYDLFKYAPEALDNTVKIANRCNVDFTFGHVHLPKFDVPEGYTSDAYLRHLCETGLKKKYEEITDELKDRMNYELSVIEKMGYADYFLIVWDYVRFAKDNGIMVGPGRGSGAGSIVAYAIGITDIDPIRYNLIFERFLNPERISMPDFDVDFCYERRQEVIDYVVEKYGKDRVAQIITFGTMAARAAIRDVGRALNMPYAQVDSVAKKIPMELGMTIDKALNVNPELRNLYEEDEDIKQLIDMSKALEGMPRHASTHAAGVVIAKEAVTNYVPLQMNEDVITTQFPMTTLEELGLLKMDFLGLRTLTVIRDTLNIIREQGLEVPDLSKIDYNDSQVYNMISEGETYGVFQLESAGMTQFMKELKPNCLEDIIAGVSLYRPGPMDQIPRYIKNKHNPQLVKYLHPKLEPILRVTYGCIIYQEQVMQVFRELAGYSMGRSDLVRRAMSKKKADVMAREKVNFINGICDENGNVTVPGCIRNGIDKETAEKIFDEMAEFAKYGFNKSHAAAYAVVSYQTAWLKHYYPVQFTAALITSVMDNSSKVAEYILNSRRLGIEVLPPDINESHISFTVKNNKIRFGLAAVKNVGINAINSIIENREAKGSYESLYDFINKVDLGVVNKRTVESLIKCGAFDSLGICRSKLMAVYERIMDCIHDQRKNNIDGQLSLFDNVACDISINEEIYPELDEYPKNVMLAMEKEMLGLYISGHPLLEYKQELENRTSINTSQLINESSDDMDMDAFILELDNKRVIMGGILESIKAKTTKNNSMMAFAQLEDLYGTIEMIIFPKTYELYKDLLKPDNIILVEGRISIKEEENAKIICEKITPLKNDVKSISGFNKLYIKIDSRKNPQLLDDIKEVLKRNKGNQPVFIVDEARKSEGKSRVMQASRSIWVSINDSLLDELKKICGDKCVALK
ncbi:DNA polymerase III subunit alpha [Lutispora sp.]|uniref:DNA polymerase III subunit alpha n=1 Tax=Lutispora sp. TaxID=2828727 RepID=UPI003567CFB6